MSDLEPLPPAAFALAEAVMAPCMDRGTTQLRIGRVSRGWWTARKGNGIETP